ncbi:MAG: hypothetical protein MK183_04515 [Verrucomicrobiales bacterium]|nr:hypothetical protein [Verrucomicrobiales bacterium]
MELQEAKIPTMYFIGVSTGASSSVRVFPRWAQLLGLGECRLVGLDFPLHDDPQRYRQVVEFIKSDPLSLGALVTSHKMNLLAGCVDLFDELDPLAEEMAEVSSIYKRAGKLIGRATDPVCGGMAMENFLTPTHFRETGSDVLILGAGGSALALVWYLLKGRDDLPVHIHVVNRSRPRLDHLLGLAAKWGGAERVTGHLSGDQPELADALAGQRVPGSLLVNATGLGKDAPGSPLTDAVNFPERGIVWDFNYRGQLLFLDQARAQKEEKSLRIEDGWDYFVIGWSQVIADVFELEIPPRGGLYDSLSRQALELR